MARIIRFGDIKPEDFKENPIKLLWQWFNDQDKFIQYTFIITLILVIATPVIVKNFFSLKQNATVPERRLIMGIGLVNGRDRANGVAAEINEIEDFKNKVGQYPGSYSIWTKLNPNSVMGSFPDPQLLSYFDLHNITPVIFMESQDPTIADSDIASGKMDDFFKTWAQAAKAYGKPVILRYDQEMNAGWFAWGHNPANFVASWKHIHDVIRGEGATNVRMFWCPWGADNFDDYYPGEDYVEYVGFDAYSGMDGRPHKSLQEIYSPFIIKLTQLAPGKPIIIGETGISAYANGHADFVSYRSQWIKQGYPYIYDHWPSVLGVIYLNFNNAELREAGRDWKLDANPEIVSAYVAVVADPRFQGSFSPSPTPTSTQTPTPTLTLTPTPTIANIGSTREIFAVEDTYVNALKPNINFNNQNYLIAGDDPKKIAYLKFNIPSFSGKKISEAKLILTVTSGKYAASLASFNLKEVLTNLWNENAVTYNNRPAAGNIIKQFKGVSQGANIEIDLTNYINAHLGKTVSFSVGTVNSDWLTIKSSENSVGKPTLIINYN